MQIVIIDGRGGKLGAALTEAMLRKFPDDALLAEGVAEIVPGHDAEQRTD